jgi:hypothetical protein
MTDEIFPESQEPDKLPGGRYGYINVWTPPAIPWADSFNAGPCVRTNWFLRERWEGINRDLQGDKPNRWASLMDAAWIIHHKLSIPIGEAQELLQTQALPPAVPWVGAIWSELKDGTKSVQLVVINRASMSAGIDFSGEKLILLVRELHVEEIHVELNHLEARLAKYVLSTVQPVPMAPARKNAAPKNNGGAPRKFDKEAFMRQAARELVRLDGHERKKRQELTATMSEWCLETWRAEPDTATLRRWMAEIFNPTED